LWKAAAWALTASIVAFWSPGRQPSTVMVTLPALPAVSPDDEPQAASVEIDASAARTAAPRTRVFLMA